MNYKCVVRDFAQRTRKNLRSIEDLQAKGGEAYEVTQLVNSMLGLIVFPKEGFIDQIPKTSLNDLEADGWPVPKVVGNFPQATDLRELVRYLRNAIAHFNIDFIGEEIESVKVCNKRNGSTTWQAEMGVNELRLSWNASQCSCSRMTGRWIKMQPAALSGTGFWTVTGWSTSS